MSVGLYAPTIHGWVKFYDPDAFDGGGDAEFTANPDEAIPFDNAGEALEFWRQISTVKPTRLDGKPNRPLTAFTIAIQKLPDA